MVCEILRHELIGLNAKVIESKNQANVAIQGKIGDETKNTITIIQGNKKKRLMKKNVVLEITFKNKRFHVDGKLLAKRPEDRIKGR